MATLRQLTFDIFNLAGGGSQNRAHPYSERQVQFWIRRTRNFLLNADVSKKKYVDQAFVQDLGCLTLTKADAALCSKYCWGENVYYVCLPELLDLPNNMAIEYFGLVDKQTRIPITEYNYGNFNKYNRFQPADTIRAQRIGSTIYLYNVDDMFPLEGVGARIVAADPANLTACGVELKCFDKDTDTYPLPVRLESVLTDMILQKEFGIARQVKADKSDDDVTTEAL